MNSKNLMLSVLLLLIGFAGGTVFAKSDKHSASINHNSHAASSFPKEGGQAAFDAMAEIVGILEANPDTNWSKVNINFLRDHLVDMNALALSAKVETHAVEQGIRFIAKGNGTTLRALQNMIPAHAHELDKMPQWSAVGRLVNGGAELVITSDDDAERKKIEGLGFFGLMATGAHHQAHHLAIATGDPLH